MIAYDTETYRFGRHLKVPKMVCVSLAGRGTVPNLPGVAREDGDIWYMVIHAKDFDFDAFTRMAEYGAVAHNAPYDMCSISEHGATNAEKERRLDWFFEATENGVLTDTQVREGLLLLAHDKLDYINGKPTRFGLDALVQRYLGLDISSEKTDPDGWRLRYGELFDVPVERWPEAAIQYAGMDSVYALKVYDRQVETWPAFAHGWQLRESDRVISEDRELAAAFAFYLHSAWGTRTNPARSRSVLADWRRRSEEGKSIGMGAGFIRKNGTLDKKQLQALVTWAFDGNPPMTERKKGASAKWKPQVRVNRETIEQAAAIQDHEVLKGYAASLQATLFLSRYAEPLELGAKAAITHSYDTLLNTGRTSAYDWPAQQPPRMGDFRGCFEPREDFLYSGADYDFIELCALGQVQRWVVGQSRLADVIDDGLDPHINTALPVLAALGVHVTYDEALARKKAKDPIVTAARQNSKAINFGLPGMMGPATFVEYAWNNYKLRFTEDEARGYKRIWVNEYPEIWPYWRWVETQTARGGIQQFISGRIRGGATGPAASNSYFQGLVADGAKYATWLLVRACYTGRTDSDAPAEIRDAAEVLRGSRMAFMLHDEIILEVPETRAAECAEAQQLTMHYAMKLHIPDVRIGCKPVLTRRWLKGADPTYNAAGRLVVTEK